ncbi:hypothetical protein P43SY_002900 [Pythium insidiosum]|uniref:Uncharacterized protein n=1 Tax=Pythium insidiosum TaxID=114742 RepID=A0AAD5Q5M0_PYTIN|nr:hypothetical protein P43SY_002900 [Pythium insidiosum]
MSDTREQDDADLQMEAIEETLLQSSKVLNDNERPRRLTMQLIRQSLLLTAKHSAQRILPLDTIEDEDDTIGDVGGLDTGSPSKRSAGPERDDEEKEIDSLLQKKVLRLDWMNVCKIENLEAFTHIQELYLQHNVIEEIEGLDDHNELTFLALGGNRIRTVQNLRHLPKLKFLDLSNNCIEDFDIQEFPPSLVILRLAGNPFVRHMPAYAHLFFERLPNLIQIDHFRRYPSHVSDTDGSDDKTAMPQSPPLTYSPRTPFIDLETEVELTQQLLSPRATAVSPVPPDLGGEDDASQTPMSSSFDFDEYNRQKKERMTKWREQLKQLESRTAALEHDVPVMTRTTSASSLRARRKLVLERTREGTKAAIADAVTHFQQMELQHKEWQERQQQAA